MGMLSPMKSTPLYSSSRYRDDDLRPNWYLADEEEFFLEILECDDFWWDEEERHELF